LFQEFNFVQSFVRASSPVRNDEGEALGGRPSREGYDENYRYESPELMWSFKPEEEGLFTPEATEAYTYIAGTQGFILEDLEIYSIE